MTPVATPSKQAILRLYHNMLRSSSSFSSYNFRNYFVEKTQETFRQIQSETDPNKVRDLYSQAVKDSTVLRRSSIVNQLYGGWKLAVEVQKAPEEAMERGNN
ncbi:hypothetical protein FA15DRAFT_664066 [Coprinopsis marcescibilis]|uniref:Complex 1 LYR protein domain-containing protein n=1 Tax=Coprinopsis marcescibilis TaxID=230819 RepID=A0A5C3LLH2_COPMA|nr:hypothetical protein FA15DRAFT_664066 [Coprinopsis marcescibilis]